MSPSTPGSTNNPTHKKSGCFKIFIIAAFLLFLGFLLLVVVAVSSTSADGDRSGVVQREKIEAALRNEKARLDSLTPEQRAAEEEAILAGRKDAAQRAEVSKLKLLEENAYRAEAAKITAESDQAAKIEAARIVALPTPPAPISSVSWKEIDIIYSSDSKLTDIVKDERWKAYKGKRVQWKGFVQEVQKELFGNSLVLSLKMDPDSFMSDLVVSLRADQRDQALKISKDDTVYFEATLKEWGSLMPVTGEDGVILNSIK